MILNAKIKNQYICADINKKEIHSKIEKNETYSCVVWDFKRWEVYDN